MSNPEFTLILFMLSALTLLAFVAICALRKNRVAKLRHDLYVKMLETGNVSKEEMEEMLHGIGAEGSRRWRAEGEPERPSGFFRFLVAVGWIGLMVAFGLGIAGFLTAGPDRTGMLIAAAIVGAASFGLVGLPIGLRELAGRGPQKTAG